MTSSNYKKISGTAQRVYEWNPKGRRPVRKYEAPSDRKSEQQKKGLSKAVVICIVAVITVSLFTCFAIKYSKYYQASSSAQELQSLNAELQQEVANNEGEISRAMDSASAKAYQDQQMHLLSDGQTALVAVSVPGYSSSSQTASNTNQ